MQDEQWRAIEGFPAYLVSSRGRVLSHHRPGEPREIPGTPNAKGYRIVTVSHRGTCKTTTMHALVAAAFIGPRAPGQQIRHLDGDPSNNAADNLRYGTQSENEFDKQRHGRHHKANKTHCPRGHEYTAENVYRQPARPTRRVCRACTRERDRDRYRPSRRDLRAA